MRRPSDSTAFVIPGSLWRVLRECETNCVGGCCGRDAFDFDAEVVRNCVIVPPTDQLAAASQQLDELIATLEAIPGPVDTLMITDEWTGPEAANWFSDFRQLLKAAADMPSEWALETTARPSAPLLKAIRQSLGLSLREAQELSDRLPGEIRRGNQHEMERLLADLQDAAEAGTLRVSPYRPGTAGKSNSPADSHEEARTRDMAP